MPYDPSQRRRALKEFLTDNGISQRALCGASKLSPSAIAQFVSGRSRSLTDETYCALADGATKMLGRVVTTDVLRGEGGSPVPADRNAVGAIAGRLADAQAKLAAHDDALREREVAALESIAKSLAVLAKSADLLQRIVTNGGGR